jgi:hypothetical protein
MARKLTDREQEQLNLGKQIQAFYNLGYINKRQALFFSFLKGIASGFGAVIGGTILVALLIWILSRFGTVPLIGHLTDSIRHTISTKTVTK